MRTSIKQLSEVAGRYGATVEEDCPTRFMRKLNVVAPDGTVWRDGCSTTFLVLWARGTNQWAVWFNSSQVVMLDALCRAGTVPVDELPDEVKETLGM